MKKIFLIIVSAIVVFGYLSCSKGPQNIPACSNKPVTADSATLIHFAGDSIPLAHDSSGLYYHIIDTGNATKPNPNSHLVVNYVAKLMNNQIFDSASNSFLGGAYLYQLIPGWQLGLPKIGVGGRIKLFIPSALAWGCTGVSGVPADSCVYFDVTLLQVN
jgi:FKBP-type peptidyl-prolyl cis-trans isomerase FkpA